MTQHQQRSDQLVLERSQAWAVAERQNDAQALECLLADEFVAVGPRGFVLTKAEWLARYRSGALQNSAFALDELTTRVMGDTAILIGRQTAQGTHQGHATDGQFRTTLIFVRRNDDWLLAGLQLVPIQRGMIAFPTWRGGVANMIAARWFGISPLAAPPR